MTQYLVSKYYPFEIKLIDKNDSVNIKGIFNYDTVGNCPIKAEIIKQQRIVGYLTFLKSNGLLGDKFVDALKQAQTKYKILEKKYTEKVL